MKGLPKLLEKPSGGLFSAIARARVIGLRPDQIASVMGLPEAQINRISASEPFAAAERSLQLANKLPLELLDFDQLLEAALDAIKKMLADSDTPALTKLRIAEEIFDCDPTGTLAKRTEPDKPPHQPSPVFDNEAIKRIKQRAAELMQ
ncbi:MAG: hypothetical protein U9Q79_07365 [Candidatus Hydrogenedentes bacterium]|nr:hypothetical protein [Candidatus Hydrogenedentota bacterium]